MPVSPRLPGAPAPPERTDPDQPVPDLSGLDSDDEDEGARPKSMRAAAPPPAQKAPKKAAPMSRPGVKPAAPAPVGDLFSDTPTKVAQAPKAAVSAVPQLQRLDASVAPQAAGSLEVTIVREKSDHPEPTITVAEDLLRDMVWVREPTPAPEPAPADPGAAGPGHRAAPEDPPPESTRVISINSVERIVPHSGPLPMVRGPSGPVPARVSGKFLGLTAGDQGQEATKIVSSLNLKELNEPRARRTRSQPVVALDGPRSGALPRAEPRRTSALGKVDPRSAPSAEPTGDGKKKNLIALIKAKTKAKLAPTDPGRLLMQQEAAERKAGEEKSGLHKFFNSVTGGGLDDQDQPEGTMIGRFLGMVGLAPGAVPPPPAKVGKDPKEEAWEVAQELPFLDGLNPKYVREAIDAGDVTLLSLGRDMLVDPAGRWLILEEGQLAVARFEPAVLEKEWRAQRTYRPGDKKAEKREQNRRQEVGPLVRLCEANLGVFLEGDVVSAASLDPGIQGLGVYSTTPVRLLSISNARVETWRRTYQFFDGRLRHATDAAKSRHAVTAGARGQVGDFFVRHGISVAMTLRVRELDKCIECYECEKACEERYGVKRLSLKGKMLGALDFVDCCRTCVDQRCIDVCAYDSIKFDPEKKEVLINEDSCTGCSMCSMACPYDAIEMHELDDRPLLRLRLEKENKLEFGDGKPRKAAIRRIASKCDHCVTYEDQACISACPTSALLEIPPEAAFIERTEDMAEAARGGYEQPAPADPVQLFNPQKFFKGLKAEDDKGRAVEKKLRTGWLWVVGLLGVVGCLIEIALRELWPVLSAQFYYQTVVEALDVDVALQNIDYRPGSDFAVWLGYIGAVILFSSTLYSAHKWIPGIRRMGTHQSWFAYHLWAGTIGPLFILLHTAAKMDNWVSLAVWAMVATVLSGLAGRYLSTELPDLASQAALRALDLERQLSELRNRHAGVYAADRYHEAKRRRFARVSTPGLSGLAAGWMAFKMMIVDDLSRPFRRLLLRRRLHGIRDRRARRLVARLTERLVMLERQRLLLPKIEPLFHEWKTVHIPFAIVLSILSGIHIFVELFR